MSRSPQLFWSIIKKNIYIDMKDKTSKLKKYPSLIGHLCISQRNGLIDKLYQLWKVAPPEELCEWGGYAPPLFLSRLVFGLFSLSSKSNSWETTFYFTTTRWAKKKNNKIKFFWEYQSAQVKNSIIHTTEKIKNVAHTPTLQTSEWMKHNKFITFWCKGRTLLLRDQKKWLLLSYLY